MRLFEIIDRQPVNPALRQPGVSFRTVQTMLTVLFQSILLCLVLASLLGAQGPANQTTPLRASAQGELVSFWQVLEADLHEDMSGTIGHLEIQNSSSLVLDGTILYAEYLDAAGRFCFSLVFSQERNVGKRGPVAPGEVRQLYSVGAGLFATSGPRDVKIHIVQQSTLEHPDSPRKWNVSFRAPVTVDGNMPADATELQLGGGLNFANGPLLDLVFARVTVNQIGLVERVDVLHQVSGEAASWFGNFIQHLSFYPATDSGVPKRGELLILVRAIVSPEGTAASDLAPRSSPWVKAYVERMTEDAEVSPLTEVVFQRPPTRVKRMDSTEWSERAPALPGHFELLLLGSEWSDPAVGWVNDPSAPYHMRRQLVVPDSR